MLSSTNRKYCWHVVWNFFLDVSINSWIVSKACQSIEGKNSLRSSAGVSCQSSNAYDKHLSRFFSLYFYQWHYSVCKAASLLCKRCLHGEGGISGACHVQSIRKLAELCRSAKIQPLKSVCPAHRALSEPFQLR